MYTTTHRNTHQRTDQLTTCTNKHLLIAR